MLFVSICVFKSNIFHKAYGQKKNGSRIIEDKIQIAVFNIKFILQ